jgi:hypothetical protein
MGRGSRERRRLLLNGSRNLLEELRQFQQGHSLILQSARDVFPRTTRAETSEEESPGVWSGGKNMHFRVRKTHTQLQVCCFLE